jgi:hypothetical protein
MGPSVDRAPNSSDLKHVEHSGFVNQFGVELPEASNHQLILVPLEAFPFDIGELCRVQSSVHVHVIPVHEGPEAGLMILFDSSVE